MGLTWPTWAIQWWAVLHARRVARHRALRHMAVVARAVFEGSTAAYTLVPDLPRHEDSTQVRY